MTKTREEWLQKAISAMRPWFNKQGQPLPKKLQAAVGFPSTGAKGKAIGEAWQPTSHGGIHTVYIHPGQNEALRVLDILLHELVHCALPYGTGHGKEFRKLATALGLTGKMTATTASPELSERLGTMLKRIGPFPHAAAQPMATKASQKCRQRKYTCPSCGQIIRAATDDLLVRCDMQGCGDYFELEQ